MPTPDARRLSAAAVTYYRSVEGVLLVHVRDRSVIGSGTETLDGDQGGQAHQVRLHIDGLADLDEAIRSGVVCFRLAALRSAGLIGLRVRPGEGAGIDTVATAALSLAEVMARDGLSTTAMTDGADGLYLIAFGVSEDRATKEGEVYAKGLEAVAPEIATTDRTDFQGRALILPLPEAKGWPAPYSLVPFADHLGAIVPLTLDEVAAASAGMPLEIEPSAVAERIRGYGDLAAALGEATAAAA